MKLIPPQPTLGACTNAVEPEDIAAAYALLARLNIRADEPTAEITARVMDALICADPAMVPKLRHSDALKIGQRLARQYGHAIAPGDPASDPLFWADLVQFVLHCARQTTTENSTNAERGHHA